jgi:hypothetical protein
MPSCWEWSIIFFLIVDALRVLVVPLVPLHGVAPLGPGRTTSPACGRITSDYTQLARNAVEAQRLMGQSIDALTHMVRVLIERQPSNGGRHVG